MIDFFEKKWQEPTQNIPMSQGEQEAIRRMLEEG